MFTLNFEFTQNNGLNFRDFGGRDLVRAIPKRGIPGPVPDMFLCFGSHVSVRGQELQPRFFGNPTFIDFLKS